MACAFPTDNGLSSSSEDGDHAALISINDDDHAINTNDDYKGDVPVEQQIDGYQCQLDEHYKFFEKQKSERMFELRRLRLGDRPVTSTNRKEILEDHLRNDDSQPPQSLQPQEVQVDIEGLIQMRPVRSLLQNQRFSMQLHQSLIQQSLQTRRQTLVPESQVPSESSSSASIPSSNAETAENARRAAPIPAEDDISLMQQWLSQLTTQRDGENSLWSRMVEEHRDSLVSELSQLIHQQVVTSTLSSTFRQSLENTLGYRMGSDPAFAPSLPGRLRQPPAPTDDDLSDSLSIFSATANVSIPVHPMMISMKEEMRKMREQMEQMRSMMQMNMQLQIELQRTMKQELSGTLNSLQQPVNAGLTKSLPVSANDCLICLDKSVNCVLYQCGHMCVCYLCAKNLQQRNQWCPVCRAPIRDVVLAYRSNESSSNHQPNSS